MVSVNYRVRFSTTSVAFLIFFIVALVSFSPHVRAHLKSSSHRRNHSDHHHVNIKAPSFGIADDMFWKDNTPFQIIGGDLHYFRIHPQYWKDRLMRAKALGLNTIQTYVPWNLHEPTPGKWTFEGFANVESYLKLCQELGFLVMLRPGPYICGEWDFGGFPSWMLSIEPPVKLRSTDTAFLQLVERWWAVLFPKIRPLLYQNGGPIIMVQIENEYGSYGEDKNYLHHLVNLARRHLGDSIILYTTDGGSRETLTKGTISGADVYSAVDFTTGDDPWPIFKVQKEFNAPGKSPPLSAEFYTGWLTHWGEKLAVTDANFTATALETILSGNGSAVLYMAHGGTNFGFLSGANTGANESVYLSDLTSYDYDAPITESGDVDSDKFKALRRVIERYSAVSLPPVPPNNDKQGYGQIKLQKIASLFDVLDTLCDPSDVIEAENPIPMESAGQMFGFLLYVSDYLALKNGSILSIPKVHDRAQVFVSCLPKDTESNPTYVGTVERWSNLALTIPNLTCASKIRLYVLVENMGRVNYGPYIYDRKGILSSVILDGTTLHGWKMFPVSFQNFSKLLKANPVVQRSDSRTAKTFKHRKLKHNPIITSEAPAVYEGRFRIDAKGQVKDTYLSFTNWGKGIVYVNDFDLGRFWPSRGPQCNLYVPAPALQHGENHVVVLELEAPNPELFISSVDRPAFTCPSKVQQL